MTLTFSSGSKTSKTAEQTIFNTGDNAHYGTWLFTHNMIAGDQTRVRVYTDFPTLKVYLDRTLSGVQTKPAFFIPYISTIQNKLTIQRITGSNRIFNWLRAEIV